MKKKLTKKRHNHIEIHEIRAKINQVFINFHFFLRLPKIFFAPGKQSSPNRMPSPEQAAKFMKSFAKAGGKGMVQNMVNVLSQNNGVLNDQAFDQMMIGFNKQSDKNGAGGKAKGKGKGKG